MYVVNVESWSFLKEPPALRTQVATDWSRGKRSAKIVPTAGTNAEGADIGTGALYATGNRHKTGQTKTASTSKSLPPSLKALRHSARRS